ncbi:cytochrome P450 [Obelidium mucronatum]|nr:cytochrome P450 [Obelidium mucronatum]
MHLIAISLAAIIGTTAAALLLSTLITRLLKIPSNHIVIPPQVPANIPLLRNAVDVNGDPRHFFAKTVEQLGRVFTLDILGSKMTLVAGAKDGTRDTLTADYLTNSSLSFRTASEKILPISIFLYGPRRSYSIHNSAAMVRRMVKSGALDAQLSWVTPSIDDSLGAASGVPVNPKGLANAIIQEALIRMLLGREYAGNSVLLAVLTKVSTVGLECLTLSMYLPKWLIDVYIWQSGVLGLKKEFELELRDDILGRLDSARKGTALDDSFASCFISSELMARPDVKVDEVLTYMLSTGFAITSNTTHALELLLADLANNPNLAKKINEEFRESGIALHDLRRSQLAKFQTLNAFVVLSLERNAPLVETLRFASKDWAVPDSNITVPAGSFVYLLGNKGHNLTTIQDSRTFEELVQEKIEAGVDAGTDFSFFGGGITICPGRFLALALLKLAILSIVSEYDLTWGDNHVGPVLRDISMKGIELNYGKSKSPVPLLLTRRNREQ